MAISTSRRIRITTYMLLAGICFTFQAFVLFPKKESNAPVVYSEALVQYFTPPQLPEKYCNAIPREIKSKKKKRVIAKQSIIKAKAPFTLLNPVLGATKKSIISFLGDARDGGRRHQGIDIVAPKGTMVIAPCEGEITEVGYNSLGGKVIRMRSKSHKCNYYFAHLDSQIVSKGMIIKRGDTLGTVGNTGNARHTRSHLHFGIYKGDGRTPVDYIRTKADVISLLSASSE